MSDFNLKEAKELFKVIKKGNQREKLRKLLSIVLYGLVISLPTIVVGGGGGRLIYYFGLHSQEQPKGQADAPPDAGVEKSAAEAKAKAAWHTPSAPAPGPFPSAAP